MGLLLRHGLRNIYIQKRGEPPAVNCGEDLGYMTDELCSYVYIEEFVSGGQRNSEYKN